MGDVGSCVEFRDARVDFAEQGLFRYGVGGDGSGIVAEGERFFHRLRSLARIVAHRGGRLAGNFFGGGERHWGMMKGMIVVRFLLMAAAVAGGVFGCSCIGNGTACGQPFGDSVAFAGRVIVDSGEGMGQRIGRMVVEDRLRNVGEEIVEVDVDSRAGTSCHFRLRHGERYVIFGAWDEKRPHIVASGGCSSSFAVRGNEKLYEAVRGAYRGDPARFVGRVLSKTGRYETSAGLAGVKVTAESGAAALAAVTDGEGWFDFPNIAGGAYAIRLEKSGYVGDEEWNKSLIRFSKPYRLAGAAPVEGDGPDKVLVRGSGCTVVSQQMVEDGWFSGRVRYADGRPAAGVPVSALLITKRGERQWVDTMRTEKTAADGSFRLRGLPAGTYTIAVNGEGYSDADPHKSVYYGGGSREAPVPMLLAAGERWEGIHLTVDAPRAVVTIPVTVVDRLGRPLEGMSVRLAGRNGSPDREGSWKTNTDGVAQTTGYGGERYLVRVSGQIRVAGGLKPWFTGEAETSGSPVRVVMPPE